MVNISLEIFNILATLLSRLVNLFKGNPAAFIETTMIMLILALILMVYAVKINNNQYDFPIRLGLGAAITFIIAVYIEIYLAGIDPLTYFGRWMLVFLLVFLAAGSVLVINFILGVEKGALTSVLWLSELLFALGSLRLFSQFMLNADRKVISISQLFPLSIGPRLIREKAEEAGIAGLVAVLEFILVIGLVFFAVYLITKAKELCKSEWFVAVAACVFIVLAYLIFDAHHSKHWENAGHAFTLFIIYAAGIFLLIFFFIFELIKKDQDGVIGIFYTILGTVMFAFAGVLSSNLAKKSFLSDILQHISKGMDYIYKIVPYGRHTDYGSKEGLAAMFGLLATMVLAIGLIWGTILIFNKILKFDETGAALGYGWYRTSVFMLVLPIALYWVSVHYTGLLASAADQTEWAANLVVAVWYLGIALMIGNIAPGFRNKLARQFVNVLVPSIVCTLAVVLIVPFIMAFL